MEIKLPDFPFVLFIGQGGWHIRDASCPSLDLPECVCFGEDRFVALMRKGDSVDIVSCLGQISISATTKVIRGFEAEGKSLVDLLPHENVWYESTFLPSLELNPQLFKRGARYCR